MVLLDHFHPPLSIRRHWHSFHNAWATYIASELPTIPLWLRGSLSLPLELNATYERTCREQRIS